MAEDWQLSLDAGLEYYCSGLSFLVAESVEGWNWRSFFVVAAAAVVEEE